VPRASLVVIAATLAQFNIPEAGLFLLLGIDHFLDMGRSATNVIGNSVATAVVAKWEGELETDATEPFASQAPTVEFRENATKRYTGALSHAADGRQSPP
jgi:Na+/H+-dicarboxylate symporter